MFNALAATPPNMCGLVTCVLETTLKRVERFDFGLLSTLYALEKVFASQVPAAKDKKGSAVLWRERSRCSERCRAGSCGSE